MSRVNGKTLKKSLNRLFDDHDPDAEQVSGLVPNPTAQSESAGIAPAAQEPADGDAVANPTAPDTQTDPEQVNSPVAAVDVETVPESSAPEFQESGDWTAAASKEPTSVTTGGPPPTVKDLTLAVALEDWIDSIAIPQVDRADPPKAIKVLGECLRGLDRDICLGEVDIFDRSKAALSWYQGKVLSLLYPLDTERFTGILKRGQFGPFLKEYWRYSASTAYWCRCIYETWSDNLQEVKRLGYTGCLAQLADSFNVHEDGIPVTTADDAIVDSEEPEEIDDADADGTTDDQASTITTPTPPKPLGNLIKSVKDAVTKLLRAAESMPESYYAPESQVGLLGDQKTDLIGIIQDFHRVLDRLSALKLIVAEQVWRDALAEVEAAKQMGVLPNA